MTPLKWLNRPKCDCGFVEQRPFTSVAVRPTADITRPKFMAAKGRGPFLCAPGMGALLEVKVLS